MAATQEDKRPQAHRTSAGLHVHSLAPGVVLLVWEDEAGDRRWRQPRATVGGHPARPPCAYLSVALASSRRRNILAVRLDAAALQGERICITEPGGSIIVASDTAVGPAEHALAFAPAALTDEVDAAGRLRIARLMLEIIPGIFRLHDSREFAAACLRFIAVLTPTPPALLPCAKLFGLYCLLTGTAEAAVGGNLGAIVINGGGVTRMPLAPALVSAPREDAPGRLFLVMAGGEAADPDAIVVIFSDHGMICRRITGGDRPLPAVLTWFRRVDCTAVGASARRYVLACLACLAEQDAQAALLHETLQALLPPPAARRAAAPIIRTKEFDRIIHVGPAAREPNVTVIGPVPDDPLLMRCRVGLLAADPAWAAVEALYVVDEERPHREDIVNVLRDVHAAYDVPARLLLVPHAGRAGAALNAGVRTSHAPVLVWLDDGVLPESAAWLGALIRPLGHHRTIGIVAARLLGEDGTLWNDGLEIGRSNEEHGGQHRLLDIHLVHPGLPWRSAAAPAARQVAVVSSDCLAVSRSLLQRCGGFSRHYLTSAYGIADLRLSAAAAGFKTCLTSEATLFRLDPSGVTGRGREMADPAAEHDRRLLERRWRRRLDAIAPAHRGRAA